MPSRPCSERSKAPSMAIRSSGWERTRGVLSYPSQRPSKTTSRIRQTMAAHFMIATSASLRARLVHAQLRRGLVAESGQHDKQPTGFRIEQAGPGELAGRNLLDDLESLFAL